MVGFSLEDAQAEIHWVQRRWLEKDPGIVLILAGEGRSALVVSRTGEVFGHTEASHSSHQQDLPFQPLGIAEKSLQGRGSPQRYPLATAASASCAGTSAALSVPWAPYQCRGLAGQRGHGRVQPHGHNHAFIPAEPTQPCQGSRAPLCW